MTGNCLPLKRHGLWRHEDRGSAGVAEANGIKAAKGHASAKSNPRFQPMSPGVRSSEP